MRSRRLTILAATVSVTLLATTAKAQAPLDAATRGDVVQKLAAALHERYVFPDVGDKAGGRVKQNLQQGAYDQIRDPAAFATRLTSDLRAVAHDKHLGVEAIHAPISASGFPTPPHSEAGVVRADRLADGISYIEVASFPPLPRFRPVIDKAMSALSGSRALIIDVRRNTGGDPASVAYLVSFLLPSDQRIHINDIVARQAGSVAFNRQVFNSEATPVNYAGRPVSVLTSARTFSGGEEFAYDVQSLNVGTVIGETTRGGANPTRPVPLGNDFLALVPYGRAENPVTKGNWEGSGVRPDLEAPASDTLKLSLRRLGQPGLADIAAASRQQVFAPRTFPVAGSEEVLRRTLAQSATGDPDYGAMTMRGAATTKRNLAGLRATLAPLGELKALSFLEVDAFGGDVYDAIFANGAVRCAIALTGDGKIDGWGVIGGVRRSNGS